MMTQVVLAQNSADDSFNIMFGLAFIGFGVVFFIAIYHESISKIYKTWLTRHQTDTKRDQLAKLVEQVCTAHGMTLNGESYQGHQCTFAAESSLMSCKVTLTLPHPFPVRVMLDLSQVRALHLYGTDFDLVMQCLTESEDELLIEKMGIFSFNTYYSITSISIQGTSVTMQYALKNHAIKSLSITEQAVGIDLDHVHTSLDTLVRGLAQLHMLHFHTQVESLGQRCLEILEATREAKDRDLCTYVVTRLALDPNSRALIDAYNAESEALQRALAKRGSLDHIDVPTLLMGYQPFSPSHEDTPRGLIVAELARRMPLPNFLALDKIIPRDKMPFWNRLLELKNPSTDERELLLACLESIGSTQHTTELLEVTFTDSFTHLWQEPWLRPALFAALERLEQLKSVDRPSDLVLGRVYKTRWHKPPELGAQTRDMFLRWLTDACLNSTPFSLHISYHFRRKVFLERPSHRFSKDFIMELARDSKIKHLETWLDKLPETQRALWLPCLFEAAMHPDITHNVQMRWPTLICFTQLCEDACAAAHLDLIDRGALAILIDSPDVFDDQPMQLELDSCLGAYVALTMTHRRFTQSLSVLGTLRQQARPEVASIYEKRREELITHAKEIGLDGGITTSSSSEHAGALSLGE